MVKKMQRAGRSPTGLIEDIRVFQDADRAAHQPSVTRIRESFEMATDAIRDSAEEKGIKLFEDIARAIPAHLVVDGRRLEQILVNLLSNAVKFTPQGHITLTKVDVRP